MHEQINSVDVKSRCSPAKEIFEICVIVVCWNVPCGESELSSWLM